MPENDNNNNNANPVYSPDVPFDGNQVGDANIKTVGDVVKAHKELRASMTPDKGDGWYPTDQMGAENQKAAREEFLKHPLGQQADKAIENMKATKPQAEAIRQSFYEAYAKQREMTAEAAKGMESVQKDIFGGKENYEAFVKRMGEDKANEGLKDFLNNPNAYKFVQAFNSRNKSSGPQGAPNSAPEGGNGPAPDDAPVFRFNTKDKDGNMVTKTEKVDYRDRAQVAGFLGKHRGKPGAEQVYTQARMLEDKFLAAQRQNG